MSNVPKSKRNKTLFEADHNFYDLRDTLTELIMMDFGLSKKKYAEVVDKYRLMIYTSPNIEELTKNYMNRLNKFIIWFIDKEAKILFDTLADISKEFTLANSIFPSENIFNLTEYNLRREHLDNALGLCYYIKQELNYIGRILPVDLDRFKKFIKKIDKQIDLFTGIRKSDNRFLVKKISFISFKYLYRVTFNRSNWWLRSVVTATNFANVNNNGNCNNNNAGNSNGVRPDSDKF